MRWLQEGPSRCQDGPWVSRKGIQRASWEHPESSPWLFESLERSWQADDALSLRFPMFLGPRTLSPYACAAKSPKAKFRTSPPYGFSWRLGPGREPLRRVQGPLLLIQCTCYLILDTWYLILVLIPILILYFILILDTYTWYLYLYTDTWHLLLESSSTAVWPTRGPADIYIYIYIYTCVCIYIYIYSRMHSIWFLLDSL